MNQFGKNGTTSNSKIEILWIINSNISYHVQWTLFALIITKPIVWFGEVGR